MSNHSICVFAFLSQSLCFFLLLLCPPLFLTRRERDILHDGRDAPRRKIVIIVIRFLRVVIVARVENAHSS